ncbi:hypothetical protein CBR_g237 [Chara braunii]|uniref:Uncharacterized protein n=1 Tax=Chara braunii TaxID=69332 RepID=A0A388JM08_CHABU|nr:hypothetical protein CBR_g237 [Chara braunii]|eukprot:GBG58837.1 hypothetical protein CBR_g237 [Chara braunii]
MLLARPPTPREHGNGRANVDTSPIGDIVGGLNPSGGVNNGMLMEVDEGIEGRTAVIPQRRGDDAEYRPAEEMDRRDKHLRWHDIARSRKSSQRARETGRGPADLAVIVDAHDHDDGAVDAEDHQSTKVEGGDCRLETARVRPENDDAEGGGATGRGEGLLASVGHEGAGWTQGRPKVETERLQEG